MPVWVAWAVFGLYLALLCLLAKCIRDDVVLERRPVALRGSAGSAAVAIGRRSGDLDPAVSFEFQF